MQTADRLKNDKLIEQDDIKIRRGFFGQKKHTQLSDQDEGLSTVVTEQILIVYKVRVVGKQSRNGQVLYQFCHVLETGQTYDFAKSAGAHRKRSLL